MIRMNAFVYPEASQGPWTRSALKILTAPSPIRVALAGSDILAVPGTPPNEDFPLERIVWDQVGPSEISEMLGQAVPPILLQQLDELPEEIACRTEIYPDDGLLMLSLPLSVDCRLCVVYRTKVVPLQIHSVRFMHTKTKESDDITQLVLTNDRCVSLTGLLNRAQHMIAGHGREGP
jgi:hypothetical protein